VSVATVSFRVVPGTYFGALYGPGAALSPETMRARIVSAETAPEWQRLPPGGLYGCGRLIPANDARAHRFSETSSGTHERAVGSWNRETPVRPRWRTNQPRDRVRHGGQLTEASCCCRNAVCPASAWSRKAGVR
jgi:hypothetical protein